MDSAPLLFSLIFLQSFSLSLSTGPPRPFSPNCLWNQLLSDSAPISPNSTLIVSNLVNQIRTYFNGVNLNNGAYSQPYYVAPPSTPTFSVYNSNPNLANQLRNVPIPPEAQPATGTDASMSIWSPSLNSVFEIWQAKQNSTTGSWSCSWGGVISNASDADGIFPFPYGLSATGLSYSASLIQVAELQAGSIDHALALAVVDTLKNSMVWPANRNDGKSNATDSIAEGTRFRFPPASISQPIL